MSAFLRIAVAPALLLLAATEVRAVPADLCARLFVPEAYGLTCTVEDGGEVAPWRIVVAPTEGPFRRFSRLSIRPVEEPVVQPRAWLRRQVALDTADLDDTLRDVFESPDNPFTGELLSGYLETMMELVDAVAASPLIGCDDAVPLADGRDFELACTWGVGGLDKYLTLRLVERDGARHLISMEAMNPRRLRHLVAIANSFEG